MRQQRPHRFKGGRGSKKKANSQKSGVKKIQEKKYYCS
jgi:hypothetical protein